MKRKLIALTTAVALSLGISAVVAAQEPDETGPSQHRHGEMALRRNPLEKLPERLNLTADQKTKVQPILDQAKPQIQAIHQEAMQKMKTVMDNTMAQIRPLLTPEQQQKLDTMQSGRGGKGKDDTKTD